MSNVTRVTSFGSAALSHRLLRAAAALDYNEAAALAVPTGAREAQSRFTEVRFLGLLIVLVMAVARAGWRLTGPLAARAGKARLVRSGTGA